MVTIIVGEETLNQTNAFLYPSKDAHFQDFPSYPNHKNTYKTDQLWLPKETIFYQFLK